MASVAHDLRTPLTALHGHLEALSQPDLAQSTTPALPRERFRLDELVTDTVQKFEMAQPTAQSPRSGGTTAVVDLAGAPPGPVLLNGDLHLIERALTNLIDNALRHAEGSAVRVSLQGGNDKVTVLVEDSGPGLPAELARRLDADHPVREPPIRRPGGGIGGLGLAIAQRVAILHGGSLRTLPAPQGGTRLAFSLPQFGLG